MPQELRAAVIALRAFNVETAQIAEQVRQAGLVPIRFQWWRDAVNSCYRGAPVKHPVVQALAQARLAQTKSEAHHLMGMHLEGRACSTPDMLTAASQRAERRHPR